MSYTTQMDAARQGIVTPEMEIVAAKENMGVEKLRELIAKGQVIIPANKNHQALSPNGIGSLNFSTPIFSFAATISISGVTIPCLAASICVV